MSVTDPASGIAGVDDLEVAGRRILVRVDFNVPLDGARITDDTRIRAALPTIRSIVDRGGAAILMSHLGRPKGDGVEPEYSLAPVAARLAELLPESRVAFASDDCVGADAQRKAAALAPGDVLLLENLRFHAEEEKNDPAFAAQLAALGDAYVNDAFGTAHRAHASMVGVPDAMASTPSKRCVAGRLLQKELRYLRTAITEAEADSAPFVAILGGAKVSGKLGTIEHLVGRVQTILVGGAMAYTFLRAQGTEVGASRVEADMMDTARDLLAQAAAHGTRLLLPDDHVVAERLEAGAPSQVVTGAIPAGWMGLDIGPASRARFVAEIAGAGTVVWNGPMGVFEIPPFDAGTRAVAEALAAATDGGTVSIVGGGDSAAAIEAFGLADRVSHVSTGGGASLQMLEGRRFEAVDCLEHA